jgi:hypothetical protein
MHDDISMTDPNTARRKQPLDTHLYITEADVQSLWRNEPAVRHYLDCASSRDTDAYVYVAAATSFNEILLGQAVRQELVWVNLEYETSFYLCPSGPAACEQCKVGGMAAIDDQFIAANVDQAFEVAARKVSRGLAGYRWLCVKTAREHISTCQDIGDIVPDGVSPHDMFELSDCLPEIAAFASCQPEDPTVIAYLAQERHAHDSGDNLRLQRAAEAHEGTCSRCRRDILRRIADATAPQFPFFPPGRELR